MALHDFQCLKCQHRFESLVRTNDPDPTTCPQCNSPEVEKKIAKFAVGGQGDLRESTQHGCHDAQVTPGTGGGHKHGPGCGH